MLKSIRKLGNRGFISMILTVFILIITSFAMFLLAGVFNPERGDLAMKASDTLIAENVADMIINNENLMAYEEDLDGVAPLEKFGGYIEISKSGTPPDITPPDITGSVDASREWTTEGLVNADLEWVIEIKDLVYGETWDDIWSIDRETNCPDLDDDCFEAARTTRKVILIRRDLNPPGGIKSAGELTLTLHREKAD